MKFNTYSILTGDNVNLSISNTFISSGVKLTKLELFNIRELSVWWNKRVLLTNGSNVDC